MARLWWRDDDARGASPALDRLIALAAAWRAPLALAVVPNGRITETVRAARDYPDVLLIQHGVDHVNRRAGSAAGEFPSDLSQAQIRERLLEGWSSLCGLSRARKIFAPPWNDVHGQLETALVEAGYAALTAWGEVAPAGRVAWRVDAHLDLLRWRGGARFRGSGRFNGTLRKALRMRRRAEAWEAPIGLLTHHLDHDAAAWRFLAEFLAWSSQESALSWVSLDQLIPPPAKPDAPLASAVGTRAIGKLANGPRPRVAVATPEAGAPADRNQARLGLG